MALWGAVIGLVGSAISSDSQRSSSNKARDAQERAAQLQVDEIRRQFDLTQGLLSPFVQGGTAAFGQMGDLVGTNGADKQAAAIAALQNSPQFQSLFQQGENAILANASATGGLRGGNTQAALGQFRPALLTDLINQQYSRLGGLASLGQSSAAGVGNAGMAAASGISNAYGQMGAAQAGGYLAQGAANSRMINGAAQALGNVNWGQLFGGGGGFTGQNGNTSVDYGIGGRRF